MTSSDSKEERQAGGLSVQTLVIASLSSLAAAIFIHKFWQGGAILGAAVTPIIVSIVSELLKRPTDRATAVVARATPVRRRRAGAGAETVAPAASGAPAAPRDDRFGLYEDRARRVRRRRLQLGIVTGLAAFAIAAFVLTGAELVIGNPLGGGGDGASGGGGGGGGTTLLGGGGSDEDRAQREERERTQEEEQPAEEEGTTEEPSTSAPDEGTTQEEPTPEEGTTPEATPEGAPGTTAPETAPAPTQPAPQTTPPAQPGGEPAP